jgi:hypothetical protein
LIQRKSVRLSLGLTRSFHIRTSISRRTGSAVGSRSCW